MMMSSCRLILLPLLLIVTNVECFGIVETIQHGHAVVETTAQIAPSFIQSSTSTIATAPAANAIVHAGQSLLSRYTELLAAHPLPTKMATGATLAVAGDAIAQFRVEDEEYDKRRAASFMVFDMSYRALQHALFPLIVKEFWGQYILISIMSIISPSLATSVTPDVMDSLASMERALASQLGIVPFMYYPVFFALTGFVQGLSVEGSIERAKENFIPLMKRNLLFWIPVQFIQFQIVPDDLQIPFLSVCGLGWTLILSIMAGSTKNYAKSSEEEELVLPEKKMEQDFTSVKYDTQITNEINNVISKEETQNNAELASVQVK